MSTSSNLHKIDREQVKMLAQQIGVRPAARKLGLPEARLLQWSKRGNWFPDVIRPETVSKHDVITVIKPSEVLENELAELERETKRSLAISARRMAGQSETADIKESPLVKNVAQVAGIVHGWGDGKGDADRLDVQILSIGGNVNLGTQIAKSE